MLTALAALKIDSAGSAAAVELMLWEGINTQQTLRYKYTAPVFRMGPI